MNSKFVSLLLFVLLPLAVAADTVWLDSLDLSNLRQGFGTAQVNRSMRETPLSIAGTKFERGVGTHANSTLWLNLGGGSEKFTATVGLDDAANGTGSVVFRILGDGKKLFESEVMKPGMPGKKVDLNLRGVRSLLLQVADGGDGIDYDHGDWADAQFLVTGAPPRAIPILAEEPIVLTPRPGPAPRINGPTIYGCRPAHPFLYRVPAQGDRPMKFSAKGLPVTLKLDATTGVITGPTPPSGEYAVTLQAVNKHGKSRRLFHIVSGDTLALTPPMGWNHWYAHYARVTDKMMREAADIMLRTGMADVGYQFVNIDDCWMNAPKHDDPLRVGPLRDSHGNLIPNRHFPDMRGLTDYIHAKGLKAGTYISPGPFTCAGFAGSLGHEAQDAKQFADWGFDFLKYDWCSYGQVADGKEPAATKYPSFGHGNPALDVYTYPYRLMGDLLKQQDRDIVYNLCQYGMGNVWEWGEAVGGHCWRTAGDLGFELDRIFEVALRNVEHRIWSRPGSWNDPDYLQIGWIGNAAANGLPKACPITPNEQYAYMSLWALMASPLFFSGDMTKLDEFTLNVLCNPEVIDVNQDAVGQSAAVSMIDESTFIMVKDLEDGSKAVGLFNRGEFPSDVSVNWSLVGLRGKHVVRDLWRQKNLGIFDNEFKAPVPRRGVVLVRIERASR